MKSQLYKFPQWGGASKVLYTFALTLIFLLPTISARADGGDRLYYIFNQSSGELQLYYGEQQENAVLANVDGYESLVVSRAYKEEITKLKIDASVADYPLTSTNRWFCEWCNLSEIEGLTYLNTSNVTDMERMFQGCSKLKSLDLSEFDTKNVTNMTYMFDDCSNLEVVYVGNNWSTALVTSSFEMFYGCEVLYGQSGTECLPGKLTVEYAHIDGGVSNPGYFTGVNQNAYKPAAPEGKQAYAVLDGTELTFRYDNNMPADAYPLTKFGSPWPTTLTKVIFHESFADYYPISCDGWFSRCSDLTEIVDMEKYLNTDEVLSMHWMFTDCGNLANINLSHFNTEKVTDMCAMFVGCPASLDVSKFKTDNVTDMSDMFTYCSGITTLDLSGFNTANVTDMSGMFANCRSLTTIYVGDEWYISNELQSASMFSESTSLKGGADTPYNSEHTDATYARIDDPENGNPGYFSKKGEPVAPALVYGVYQITSAVDLLWFANYVNSGNPNANAKLCADIILNENLLSKIKEGETSDLVTWIPIGTADNPYKGTFTTDTFAISGLYVNDPEKDYVGLFGYYDYDGESLSDMYFLTVKDSYFAGHDYVGGLFGYVNSPKIHINNFYFRGEVSGNSNVGGLFGKIDNFNGIRYGYVSAKVTGNSNVGSVCGYSNGNNYLYDSYYDTQLCTIGAINGTDDVENNIIGKNTFNIGEIAYLLNICQNLSDPSSFPEFKGQYVHKNLSGNGYHNPDFEDFHCKHCIHYTYVLPQKVNGVYQISNADELYGFMHIVNTGDTHANAVLTENIEVNKNVLARVHAGDTEGLREWYSIGDNGWLDYNFFNGSFAGVFDGNFHTISGLYFDSQIKGNVQCGFIGNLNGIVKNVIIVDTYFKTADEGASGIACYLQDKEYDNELRHEISNTNPLIENCIFDGEIIGGERAAGICLSFAVNKNDDFIKNCINYGKIIGGTYSGGILGASWGSGSVVNCYNAGELVSTDESDGDYTAFGGICGGASVAGISNCYNTGSVNKGYGVYGWHWSQCNITNTYNNSDICNLPIVFDEWVNNTITGGGNLTTAELCNGELPEGFSSDDWIPGSTKTTEDGIVYTFPHLKVFEDKYPAYSIVEKLPVAIEIKTKPTQMEYALGENYVQTSGAVVTFKYSDNTEIDVDFDALYKTVDIESKLKEGLDFSDFDHTTTGKKTITVTYNDLSTQFDITVVDKGNCGYQYLDENGTLTFYCGQYRTGAGYIGPNGCSRPFKADDVTKAVFDPSFDNFYPTNLTNMLSWLPNLQEIVDMDKYLHTSDVVDMRFMFASCPLETLDLSSFDTRSVTNMFGMFVNYDGDSKLKTIYVGENWSTVKIAQGNGQQMFLGCTSLIGGKGTVCDGANNDYLQYARIDDPEHDKPGFFTPKGEPTDPVIIAGEYQITNATDLLWFSNYVNSGNTYANAKLCANIVLNDNLLSKIKNRETDGLVTWIPIGTEEYPFKGKFTTDTFAISGLYVNDPNLNYVGLFGYYASDIYMTYGNYISVKDSYFAGHDYVGGICGYVNSEKVRLSDFYFRGEVSGNSNVGGLFGKIDVFENISSGYVSAKVTGSSNVGSVCGYLDGKTENNYFNNLYYDTQLCTLGAINGTDDVENYIIGKNTFHTGEVANILWLRQDLSDPSSFPEFKGQFVHKNLSGVGYHNPVYQDNHCTKCINYTYEPPQLVNGVYQISTADELYGFMHIVNTGNNYANAVLTADIVVNENVLEKVHSGNTEGLREWYSIGEAAVKYGGNYEQDNPFYGVFDGNLHSISGLYFDSKISGEDQGGLFAYVLGTVKNVIVKDAYFKSEYSLGGISYYMGHNDYQSANPVIENCIFGGEIFGSGAGGICKSILDCSSSVIKNCINLGIISVNGIYSYSGGILGVDWGGGNSMVTNCYNAGEIIVRPEFDVPSGTTDIAVGGICGGAMINSISNCYNTGKVTTGYGIYGTHWGAVNITNAYNNSDICKLPFVFDEWGNNNITGGGNTTTATLCNGELPEGFSSDDWIPGKTETKDGKIVYTFPHLKVFDGKYPAYTIEEKLPIAIEIKTPPTQTEYALGENLYSNGLVVTFKFDDNTGIDIDYYNGFYESTSREAKLQEGLTLSDFDNTTTGKKTVTVRYQDLSAQFEVNVVDRGVCGYQYLDEDGTLTFYYGEYKNGAGYIGPNGCSRPFDGAQVKKAVFDPSFKDFKPTNLTNMLCFVPNLQEIVDMDKYLNTEEVVNMMWMFGYCPLTVLDLSAFDTRKVKNMGCMFADCSGQTNFTTIYVGDKWSTENVDPCMMFFNCTNLVGEKGTKCNETLWDINDYIYARIDDPEHGKPGYFTYKAPKPENPYTEPEVKNNAYQISSAEDLLYFMFDVNNGNVDANAILTQDIVVNADLFTQISDLLKRTTKAGNALNEWTPIGTAENPFRGTFDGNGHIISGIYIKDETQNNVGLFGNVSKDAVIKNLGVTDSYIAGNENVGAICGKSEGTVVNCYTVSEVKGSKNVNPLVGAKEKAAVVQNSFYLADSPKANDPCAKTAEQFKSGEVAAQLAKGATINGVTYSGESFAGLTELPGTENIEVISDPENPPTPVSEISPNINVNVWSYNHIIYIDNAPDAEYRIIDLNGRLITTSTTKSTKEEIQINKSGILIVIIGNQSFKVSL